MLRLCSVSIGLWVLIASAIAQEGSAVVTGKVTDWTGAAIPDVAVELLPERPPGDARKTRTDETGVFRFSELPADLYTLKLLSPGFQSLTVQSILISEGDDKSMPTLQLEVGAIGDCGPHAVLDHIRFLPARVRVGNVGGSVRLDRGPMDGNSPPVAGAEVALCGTVRACYTTQTDSSGQFIFNDVPPGDYSVRVKHAAFYPTDPPTRPGYKVNQGVESIYYPIYIERCRRGNCDPRLRPKKPLVVCE